MWPWHVKMPTQNLLRLLMLLMLMMRIVLATVCCILGSWGLVIKPNFCSDFQHKVSSRFWSWSSGRILKLEFGQYFAADVLQRLWRWILVKMLKQGLVNILNFKFSRGGDVWCGFWSKCLVEILKMKFEQDLCLNLWYDPIGYFGKMNSTLGSVVPLAMFNYHISIFWIIMQMGDYSWFRANVGWLMNAPPLTGTGHSTTCNAQALLLTQSINHLYYYTCFQ